MFKFKNIFVCLFSLGMLAASCTNQSTELQWHQKNGYQWAELPVVNGNATGFETIRPSDSGIHFQNHLSESDVVENRNYLNGSGVAADDVDGDGLVDLYFAQLDGPNKLYKNLGGFRFQDITDSAGVAHQGYYSTGTVFADVDGDSDSDLLVASVHKGVTLYMNNGNGRFTPAPKKQFINTEGKGSTTLALADIDGDDDLDLYITNYKSKSAKDLFSFNELRWENTTERDGNSFRLIPPFDEHYAIIQGEDGPTKREYGIRDQLYLNNGDGTFTIVEKSGDIFRDFEGNESAGPNRGWGLTAKFYDINNDNLPDLYVCNDFWTPDQVWINQGDGTFHSMNPFAIRNFSFSSMGVDFSDINRDGMVDFFVTEMLSGSHQRRMRQLVSFSPVPVDIGDNEHQPQYMRNTLYLGREDHTFAEIARFSGVEASEWSWATNFLDVDLDGYEDLIITTGNAYDVLDLDTQEALNQRYFNDDDAMHGYILEYPPLQLQNKIFKNTQDLTFIDQSTEWGFSEKDISHGLAMADLDNDGDLDLASNRLNQNAAIFENGTTSPRIAVQLIGKAPNTDAIGAKIKLEGGPVTQTKELSSGGSYLSGSDPLAVFAATLNNDLHRLTITWPGGSQTVIDSVAANRIYKISQTNVSANVASPDSLSKAPNPLFKDISQQIDYSHYEEPYDEDQLQPLLPLQLSRLGPGVSWIDYDRDNDDDLFISTGRGGQMGIYKNESGNFVRQELGSLTSKAPGDQTTILGLPFTDRVSIIVGSANYEQERASVSSAYHYSIGSNNDVVLEQEIRGVYSTTGPIMTADYNGDGAPDLFIGGRVVPDQYPVNASSRLFINQDGEWILDRQNSDVFKNIGMVTGSVFTDVDMDGDQDILLSTEWGPLKLFRNDSGQFIEVTQTVGLDEYKGLWNGVTTGDFNNDGRPDILATNRGVNISYQPKPGKPLRIYYGDFDYDRQPDIIETYYSPEIGSYVPNRRLYELYGSINTIAGNVRSHKDFAESSLRKILNTDPSTIPSKEVNTLAHTLFLNNGDHFTPHSLPVEAQFTTAFHAGVADFDNDGNEDLLLSQNLFALPKLTSRQDAGRGLLLKGDGQGNFKPVPGSQSGIKVYGEQRGAALSDFNGDGRTDLAISQNGAATKLYQNQTEKAGIIVRLDGPSANPDGIGSSLRIVYADGTKGPRREIQTGSGYWSQNSAVQVMGFSKEPSQIEVTWFDGTVATYTISADSNRYSFSYPE